MRDARDIGPTHRRVLCFGEALIDFLADPALRRAPAEGAGEPPLAFLRQAGGAPANVAVAVARLGGDAAFVGMIGADPFGDFLVESLRRHRVDVAHVRRTDEAKTALAFVALDAVGERSFSFYRAPGADQLFRAQHFDDAMFDGACAFHACSNTLTDAASAETTYAGLARARAHGVLVSIDLNLRPALWPPAFDPLPRLWRLLADADVVKLSGEELASLATDVAGVDAALSRLFAGPTRLVVVTHGAGAPQWFTRDDRGEVPAIVVDAVDTTAAGDAFVGGFLFELARRGVDASGLASFVADRARLEASLRFATACGAASVTRRGAFDAMPTRDAVEALLRAPSPGSSADRREIAR